MNKEYKWIRFELAEQKTKTSVFNIIAKEGDLHLGKVKWFASWRKYCFFPAENTIFETQCLSDIISFITDLMNERKSQKQSLKELILR